MTRLFQILFAVLVLLAGPAPACSRDQAPPIQIGLIAPLTGGTSAQGRAIRDGATLAVAEINRKGGVLGRELQLVERDDRSNNEVGSEVANELTAMPSVAAAIGYGNTGAALAGQWHFEEAEVPLIVTAATGTL
ncbi:MAG TPA: ABC transporter substrate-binding protein, partial [Stellaceae bacterium]|nr:ABC transporter substrate-binding protein [Stellaceae bacterium]